MLAYKNEAKIVLKVELLSFGALSSNITHSLIIFKNLITIHFNENKFRSINSDIIMEKINNIL